MKEITCFKTEDGTVFTDMEDAQNYESAQKFKKWFEDTHSGYICGLDGNSEKVCGEELFDWIQDNEEIVKWVVNRQYLKGKEMPNV